MYSTVLTSYTELVAILVSGKPESTRAPAPTTSQRRPGKAGSTSERCSSLPSPPESGSSIQGLDTRSKSCASHLNIDNPRRARRHARKLRASVDTTSLMLCSPYTHDARRNMVSWLRVAL